MEAPKIQYCASNVSRMLCLETNKYPGNGIRIGYSKIYVTDMGLKWNVDVADKMLWTQYIAVNVKQYTILPPSRRKLRLRLADNATQKGRHVPSRPVQ